MALGLCSQTDLDAEVRRAARRLERERIEAGLPEEEEAPAGTLLSADETTDEVSVLRRREEAPAPERPLTVDDVFGPRGDS